MSHKHYDTVIIGAGISGCAVARYLSRYRLKILVIDAEDDIAGGATKANSGIVHAGYDCHPGTLKAKLNVEGTAMFPKLAKELNFPFMVNGSLVLCFHKEEYHVLEELYERGKKNGVPGLKLLTPDEAYKIEPNLAVGLASALWAPNAGIVSPYEAAIALAENAAENGAEFLFETVVTKISKGFVIETSNGTFEAGTIVNAAGINADIIYNYLSENKETILPQRGEYYLLDNAHRGYVNCTLFPLPSAKGKGILIAPTVDGNTLIGPNAEDIDDRHDTQTTQTGLNEVLEKGKQSVADLPVYGRITTFAGLRAKHKLKDFIINESVTGFYNALGIDSPGLSAAPAIGKMLSQMVADRLSAKPDPSYNPNRKSIKRFSELSFEEKEALICKNPKYGHMVCRCETVTEAEIIEAINRPLGAKSLAALKRRTRAQMGRCQGGFCSIKLAEILARELGVSEESIWTY